MKQKTVSANGIGGTAKDGPLHPLHSLLHPFSQSQPKLSNGLSKKGREITPSSSFLLGGKGEKLGSMKYTSAPGGRTFLFENAGPGNVERRGTKYDNSHVSTIRHAVGAEVVTARTQIRYSKVLTDLRAYLQAPVPLTFYNERQPFPPALYKDIAHPLLNTPSVPRGIE
ncbi:hypothetical protein PoB_006500200 [Plakobranchus ocellatus]|uniref:Uncharacterized protein n=1 Tax=Plakobranchus ocellatus TaxID=259542 RepID=A0AAV4D2T6_9GAST|nr:hypothetical protein PoB_006500200 [Plakobranchus ocellatus]